MRQRRSWPSVGVLLALVVGSASCSDDPVAPAAPSQVEPDWSQDERLRALLAGCARGGYFEGDTSDLLPVLVDKLITGQRDVILNLRAELAALGDRAVPELERVARELYSQRDGVHAVQNILGTLWLSDASGAAAVLAGFLTHPHEVVRSEAIRGLTKHARAEHFDPLLATLPITQGLTRITLAEALHRADARRFEATFADWMRNDEVREVWPTAARLVLSTADAKTAETFAPLVDSVAQHSVVTPLLGAWVRGSGDEAAFARLEAELFHEDSQRRTLALEVLEHVGGHLDLAARVLREDNDTTLRVLAVSLITPHAADSAVSAWLRPALDDPSFEVQQMALAALLSAGDDEAADRVVALLGRSRREMQMALFAVRDHWEANPGLAQRVLEMLDRRQRDEVALSPQERKYLIQAIGLVPGRASAELLLELGQTGDGIVDRMPLHQFHVLHIGNTGPEGLELLRERYSADDDPARRMDYLWGTTFGRDDTTRQFLMSVLETLPSSPHEKLLVAERLVRMGPASEVAPLLKRVTLRVEQPDVRIALQCLLWQWYG